MTIRFGDIIEQLRMRVIKDIEYILDNSQTSVQSDKAILYYFYMLRQNNNKLYKNIIGLIAGEHYKIIKEYSILDKSKDEDELFINLYESLLNQDELIAIIEEEPAIIISILSYMNEFECYDYFEKRQCYLINKNNLDTLFKLSPCSVLDYLYYCQKYDMNTLKIIYEENNIKQEDLKKRLQIDISAVTRILKTLEDKGFIIKKTSKEDKRNHVLSLTSKGKELYPKIKDVIKETTEMMIKDIDQNELILLEELLLKMKMNLEDTYEK